MGTLAIEGLKQGGKGITSEELRGKIKQRRDE